MGRFLDIVLYPAKMFEKLTDNKLTLAAGVVFVGLIDFFVPDIREVISSYFTTAPGRSSSDVSFNIAITILLVLLLGVIDVVFFAVPLYDIFKYFKKKEGQPHSASVIKVVKVYIMSHFIMIPVVVVLYFALFKGLSDNSSLWKIYLAAFAQFVIMIWSSAIISRGINALFKVGELFKRFSFMIVFIWSFIFGVVFDMKIKEWLLMLLR